MRIYNSRNSKDLIVGSGAGQKGGIIYNSRNSKDLIVGYVKNREVTLSTTVEIQKT